MEMAILVINSGSSSLKVSLFKSNKRLIDFQCNPVKSHFQINYQNQNIQIKKPYTINNCLNEIFNILKADWGIPSLIAHRFVHGGAHFRTTQALNQELFSELKKLIALAPVHNRSCYEGIAWVRKRLGKNFPQVIVFDTAFFKDLPNVAKEYAIPKKLTQKYAIQRYGFHGISHQYLAKQFGDYRRLITVHLGSGCSIAAIFKGKPIDVSMGFTPLEGLVMATRSGDLDPSIVAYLSQKEKLSSKKVMDILNFQSGLLGIAGQSDMKNLIHDKSSDAQLAIEIFCYRLCKYIGSYIAILGGCDAIVFTGGIGENSYEIRQRLADIFKPFGVKIHSAINQKAIHLKIGEKKTITTHKSSISWHVISSDENRQIAEEARKITNRLQS